jgi:hypothetical protein
LNELPTDYEAAAAAAAAAAVRSSSSHNAADKIMMDRRTFFPSLLFGRLQMYVAHFSSLALKAAGARK